MDGGSWHPELTSTKVWVRGSESRQFWFSVLLDFHLSLAFSKYYDINIFRNIVIHVNETRGGGGGGGLLLFFSWWIRFSMSYDSKRWFQNTFWENFSWFHSVGDEFFMHFLVHGEQSTEIPVSSHFIERSHESRLLKVKSHGVWYLFLTSFLPNNKVAARNSLLLLQYFSKQENLERSVPQPGSALGIFTDNTK